MLAKRFLPGIVVALFALIVIYNTNLNNAYTIGATLHDSSMFATAMWRSGWQLTMAPALGAYSYLVTHFSPLLLVPNALSYLYPGDMIGFTGLVYGLVYAALAYAAYSLLLRVGMRPLWAGLGSFAFFMSQSVYGGAWEARMEVVTPVFAIMTFWAWQERRYRSMLAWHMVNALLREDIAMVFGIPLVLLAFAQWFELRVDNPELARERRRWGLIMGAVSFGATVLACVLQKTFFPGFDIINSVYFSKDGMFAHLNLDLVLHRLGNIFDNSTGLWMPIIAVAVAAVLFYDAQLLAGAVAFLPFLLVNIISKDDLSGTLGSYKAFPVALLMLWPALVLLTRSPALRRSFLILQAVVLVCGVSFFAANGFNRADRWFPSSYTQNSQQYQQFEFSLLELMRKNSIRASHGVLALYPYRFKSYHVSNIQLMTEESFKKTNMLIWFEGDRDQAQIDKLLSFARFNVTQVAGTKIRIGRRAQENLTPPVQ